MGDNGLQLIFQTLIDRLNTPDEDPDEWDEEEFQTLIDRLNT